MKEKKLQLTMEITKGLKEITTNNNIPRNLKTWVKWKNF